MDLVLCTLSLLYLMMENLAAVLSVINPYQQTFQAQAECLEDPSHCPENTGVALGYSGIPQTIKLKVLVVPNLG